MALKDTFEDKTLPEGSDIVSDCYIMIPRLRELDFYIDDDVVTFKVYLWRNESIAWHNGDPLEDFYTGKSPMEIFQVILWDTPRDIPVKMLDTDHVYYDKYSDVINIPQLSSYIANKITSEGASLFDVYKKGIMDQWYPYFKTITNFCGRDMTGADDVPPVNP